jgi:hypothetical protein
MIFVYQALRELAPDATWTLIKDDLDNIIWNSEDISQPSKKDILAKAAELEAQEEAQIQAQQVKKQAAETKLAALGLTPEDLKMLLG